MDNHKVVKAWQTWVDLVLREIIGAVSDLQLDPSYIWERLQATQQVFRRGLGSIISIWQHFFTLKKANDTSVQVHTSVICELADLGGWIVKDSHGLSSHAFPFKVLQHTHCFSLHSP